MSENLVSREDRTIEEWIDVFETTREGMTNLKKYRIRCEERVAKANKEIELLKEKIKPDINKMRAIDIVIERINEEKNNVEQDRQYDRNRKNELKRIEKERKLFKEWRREHRSEFGKVVQDRILRGIENEKLTFNQSYIRYSAHISVQVKSEYSLMNEHDGNMYRCMRGD